MEPSFRCNACGCERPLRRRVGREYAVCSIECVREMEWRNALMALRKPYEPSQETIARAKQVLGEKT